MRQVCENWLRTSSSAIDINVLGRLSLTSDVDAVRIRPLGRVRATWASAPV